jgi:hypothetical protein
MGGIVVSEPYRIAFGGSPQGLDVALLNAESESGVRYPAYHPAEHLISALEPAAGRAGGLDRQFLGFFR